METGRKTDCESRTSAASELLARCGVRADGAMVGRARQETLEREREIGSRISPVRCQS